LFYFHILYFYTEAQSDKALETVKEKIDISYADYFDNLIWEKHRGAIHFGTEGKLTDEQMEIVKSLGADPDEMDLNNEDEDD
jgi:hypothetical protein